MSIDKEGLNEAIKECLKENLTLAVDTSENYVGDMAEGMRVQNLFDVNSIDRSEFEELDNLLEQKRNSFYRGMLRCQEQYIQQLID